MLFLDIIYDALKGEILGHDNFFKYPDSQYFPGEGRVKHYYPYVGEIVDSNDKPFVIEINSVPGMSNESIVPQMANALNIKLSSILV